MDHTHLLRNEEEDVSLSEKVVTESKKIWSIALPGVISRVCSFGCLVVTQSFIGHVSDVDLAGYALVQTLNVMFVNGVLVSR